MGNDLKLTPLSQCLGAEVSDVDLGQPVSQRVAKALSLALDQYTVLLFRDQHVSEANQIKLANIFGE